MVCAWCGCHLPDHIPCRRPQPVFRGRPPRRQFAALAYRLRSPWSAAPMAHESIEGERVPTEMCDHSHQKPRRIVGQHEQARTPGPRSGGAFLQRWTSDGGRARWCPTRRVLVVPKVELAPRDIVSCVLGCLGFGGFIGVSCRKAPASLSPPAPTERATSRGAARLWWRVERRPYLRRQ